jgi:pimeloyl-ACP methyl ester carboxylesterase
MELLKIHKEKAQMTAQTNPRSEISVLLSRFTRFLVVLLSLSCLLPLGLCPLSTAYAQGPALPLACQPPISLPTEDIENPQLALICLPQVWNGQLVAYAHGYVPQQLPLALPLAELTVGGQFLPEPLLAQGFAFVTTSFRKNGYAIEQAGEDLNNLVEYFKTQVAPGPVTRVFLAGASEGGLITTMLLERFPGKYDGGLALCGPLGGAPYQTKYLGDFRVVFDFFFPAVFSFGAFEASEFEYLKWGDLNSGYVHDIGAALLSNPDATRQLFQITRAALNPQDPASSAVTTSLGILFYDIWGSHDLTSTAGGIPYGNQFTLYLGSDNDLALNRGVQRVRPDLAARDYLRHFYQTTGRLQRPLVALHTTLDPVAPFNHELIYAGLATLARRVQFLTVLPVPRYGHCNFTAQEVLGAFSILAQKVGSQASNN